MIKTSYSKLLILYYWYRCNIYSLLYDQYKGGFFGGPAFIQPGNQSNLKSFQKALIGWKKATFVLIM